MDYILNGKIDVIKLVRSCSNLGLVDAKELVEFWMRETECGAFTSDGALIKVLLNMVGKLVRGEWEHLPDGTFVLTREPVGSSHIKDIMLMSGLT